MAFIEGVRLTSPTHLATRLEMRLSFIHYSTRLLKSSFFWVECGAFRVYRYLKQGLLALLQICIKQVKSSGLQPVISNPCRQVMRLLERARIPEFIGEDFITVWVNDAVILAKVLPRTELSSCPQNVYM